MIQSANVARLSRFFLVIHAHLHISGSLYSSCHECFAICIQYSHFTLFLWLYFRRFLSVPLHSLPPASRASHHPFCAPFSSQLHSFIHLALTMLTPISLFLILLRLIAWKLISWMHEEAFVTFLIRSYCDLVSTNNHRKNWSTASLLNFQRDRTLCLISSAFYHNFSPSISLLSIIMQLATVFFQGSPFWAPDEPFPLNAFNWSTLLLHLCDETMLMTNLWQRSGLTCKRLQKPFILPNVLKSPSYCSIVTTAKDEYVCRTEWAYC